MPQSWRPDIYARRIENLRIRSKVIKAIRSTFDADGFMEVETPILQHSPGNEVHLHAFKTSIEDSYGDKSAKDIYLHTSPEFAMKKLLVAGEEKIYQIARVFRNGERSSLHHPEFSMIEWYRAHENYTKIMDDCVSLVRAAAQATNMKTFKGCDPFATWEKITVAEAFEKYCSIDILATAPNPLKPDRNLLHAALQEKGYRTLDDDCWDDMFFRLMGTEIEPYLGKEKPTFLYEYPLSMAALSRQSKKDQRIAERFELYIAGTEIANAFGELTDPDEQLQRFEADMDLKEKMHGIRYPIDMDFIAALRHGMPEASGIALGIDRLVMLCTGAETIDDVLWLPV